MSKIGLIILLCILTGTTFSQDYFVFIASDHRQPFYVMLDSQLYSSSPEGHLLLAPLRDSDYTMTIGFPGKIFPEQRYAVSVRGKDREFELRQRDDGSWRLYDELGRNWVTVKEKEKDGGEPGVAGIKKDDAFSRMMAGVVHDTAVLYNTFAMEQVLKDSPVSKSVPVADTAVALRVDSLVAVRTDSPPARRTDTSVVKRSDIPVVRRADSPLISRADSVASVTPARGVVKLSEKKTSRSLRQVYIDNRDTVVVIIPRDTVVASARLQPAKISPGRSVESTRSKTADTSRARSADTSRGRLADTSHVASTDTARQEEKGIPYINSDCHNFATENDVDRLRVKMLEAASDEDRLAVARKVFKTKCFYTPHLRALSEVFTTDASKFRFFEVAWPFAADEHFQELSGLLKDPVYISRFKTMTGGRP